MHLSVSLCLEDTVIQLYTFIVLCMTRCAWSLPDPGDSGEARCAKESTTDSVATPGELQVIISNCYY